MSPLLLLALQTPAPSTIDLRQPPIIAETTRLELTPRLDGRIEEEEWDPLGTSGDVKTYFQWEPGALHVAAAAAMGKDLLVSIDPGADGWLVGATNLEARIGQRDGKPFIKLRILDATNVAGPVYREIPNLEAASSAAIGADGTIEATIADPGLGLLPTKGGKLAVRVDVVAATDASPAANEPRALASLLLSDSRTTALPGALKSKVDFNDIATIPGENATVRFGFTGTPMPKRIAIRSEGLAREATSATELPFPGGGKKGTSVEYRTGVQADASVGYRIARATVTGADGVPGVVQASYRIAPLVDVDLNDAHLRPSDSDRSIRVGYLVTGNSRGRLQGRTTISVPGGYRVLNGDDAQKITLFEPRRGLPKSFGLFIPAKSQGTVPVHFAMEINGKKFDVVRYLTID